VDPKDAAERAKGAPPTPEEMIKDVPYSPSTGRHLEPAVILGLHPTVALDKQRPNMIGKLV
jgi:hypothetical protein